MTAQLRNVDADLHAPVEQWPFEAVLAALERGGVRSWARIARAIRTDPWGPVARKVEQALRIAQPYGVQPLMESILTSARTDRERAEREQVASRVRDAVERSGMPQSRFAAHVGTSASRLSTYATGRVVPSAAMLIRIEGTAARTPTAAGTALPDSSRPAGPGPA